MGRAAAGRAEGDTGALEELEFHWGSAYEITAADGMWTARHRDGRGDVLADPLPEGLRLRIQADYEAIVVWPHGRRNGGSSALPGMRIAVHPHRTSGAGRAPSGVGAVGQSAAGLLSLASVPVSGGRADTTGNYFRLAIRCDAAFQETGKARPGSYSRG